MVCPAVVCPAVAARYALLSARQRALLDAWLPGVAVDADHSWGLVETTVLEVSVGRDRYIVKAGGAADHHIAREIHAHRHWLAPWTAIGRAPALVRADVDAKLLMTRYLPGRLVLGTPHADLAGTYEQAGRLLALLHAQAGVVDDGYEASANRSALRWLDGPHRIAADDVERLRSEITSWPVPPATLVPTHGDWQPRNWLVHQGTVAVIDLGRAALRPAMSDLTRIAVQELRGRPDLEAAFLAGYGSDPREPAGWRRALVREAISTAAWAHQVGDAQFEAQGLRMVADVLAGPA